MDTKTTSQIFENNNVCGHLFCLDCIRQHVAIKIKENITKAECPDPNFKGVIGSKACRSIVPEQVLKRSENILCDSVIMESQKFYCPFKDCSAMLVGETMGLLSRNQNPPIATAYFACSVRLHDIVG
ncbi:putative Zinc finger, RING/FYVE/PHD-type, E3 ubiquitin ligase RBR family [Helianthus debilis subsp. tardiflorus]